MAVWYFGVLFAEAGDKSAVPNPTQPSGVISYTEGWGPDYELDQAGPGSPKDVDRQAMNQLGYNITSLLQELQENGLPIYDATYNYPVDGYTIGSDGIIYRSAIINGPATSVVDPVGDLSGTWFTLTADIRIYSATFDYAIGNYVKGSDDNLYIALIVNGPTSSVVDPVGDTTGTWKILKSDVAIYSSSFAYVVHDYAKGSDGQLYRATTTTTGTNPVGDLTGTWVLMSVPTNPIETTVFTASDPTWAPNVLTKALRVIVTGGGGGGGGTDTAIPLQEAVAVSGGAGGTAIKTVNGTIAATYAVVIGAGGAGGLGSIPDTGATGGLSSFAGVGISTVTGLGGIGGLPGSSTAGGNTRPGSAGGSSSNGDINIDGGGSSLSGVRNGEATIFSVPGGSYWGGPPPMTIGAGVNGIAYGTGGTGPNDGGSPADGGDGAPGVVVVEEYF